MYGWDLVLDMYENISTKIDQALDVWVSVSAGHVSELSHHSSSQCMGEV